MWISKDGEERKQELLETAFELFCEKGFHKTSINDIISRVGVTKGAFYYYFKSMEEVLESIALREAAKLMEVARKYAENRDLGALDKLKGLMVEAVNYNKTNADYRVKFFKLMQDEENAKLAQRINRKIYEVSFPLIRSIIEQGIGEGVFKVEVPEDAAELYIQLSSIYKNSLSSLLAERAGEPGVIEIVRRKLAFYQQVLETVLGIERGCLNIKDIMK